MQPKILKCRQNRFDLSKKTYVMGVLNITPDSFSDGGLFLNPSIAVKRALQMEADGADIIDIGGESTRPNSLGISQQEELKRIIPVLKQLKKRLKVPISVDTTKAIVAQACLDEGVSIINDISGLHCDERIASLCARYSAGLVIMHMKGTPRTMQRNPGYKNLLKEIQLYINKSIEIARLKGLKKENIIIDPGIGFGKSLEHNLKIINELSFFKKSGFCILIGLSRKSFIGKALSLDANERLIPTIAADTIAILNGANIIRVHDVKEAVMAAKITDMIRKSR